MLQKLDKRIFVWEKSFRGDVVRLAWPIMVQGLVTAFMFIVDNLMIGQLGESALAGVTQANRITFLMQVTMFGVVSGASVFTAQYWGTRDLKGIHKTLGLAMIVAACVSLLYALPAIFASEFIMRLLLHNEGGGEAVAAGASYLRVVGFAYLFQALSMVQSAVLKSTEQVRLPMYATSAAIVTNVLFNWLLIFGNLGFPRLGAAGGAIATVLACAAELGILLVVGYRMKLANSARLRALHPGAREDVKRFFRVVLPTMANEGFWALGTVMYSVAFGIMGPATVAAESIFRNVEQLTAVALRGATSACAVLIGMAIGSGREEEAQLTAKRMLVLGAALGLAVGALVLVIGPFMVARYPVSAEVAASARALTNTYACCFWVQSIACLLIVGILRSGGDVRYAMFVDVLPVWLIGIPLVFLSGPVLGWPVHWVYLLTRVEEFVKSAIGLRRLRGGKWINNLVRGDSKRDGAVKATS